MTEFPIPEGMSFQQYQRSTLRDMQETAYKRRIYEQAQAKRKQQNENMEDAP